MKDKYIDEYGTDSLPQLSLASMNKIGIFITMNEELLKDRIELEKKFNIKIRHPKEWNKKNK